MGAYIIGSHAAIKIGAYIHGCLFCVGAYYPNFTNKEFITLLGSAYRKWPRNAFIQKPCLHLLTQVI